MPWSLNSAPNRHSNPARDAGSKFELQPFLTSGGPGCCAHADFIPSEGQFPVPLCQNGVMMTC